MSEGVDSPEGCPDCATWHSCKRCIGAEALANCLRSPDADVEPNCGTCGACPVCQATSALALADGPTPRGSLEAVQASHAVVRAGRRYQRASFASSDGSYMGHVPARRYDEALDSLIDGVPALIGLLRNEIDRLDKALNDALKERDAVTNTCDLLAAALGGPEIGEHTSANDPWANALQIGNWLHVRLAGERDAARATAASLEAELAGLRKWLTAKAAEASRESDYGVNVDPLHRLRVLEMVMARMDKYPHGEEEGRG